MSIQRLTDVEMHMKYLTHICAALVILPLPAFATNDDLFNGCRDAVRAMDGHAVRNDGGTDQGIGYCLGWVQGMRSMSDYWQSKHSDARLKFVIPDDVTNGQIMRILVAFLDQYPAARDKHEFAIFLAAMGAAFPKAP